MEHEIAISLEGICKSFGSVKANDNISLEIRRGEVLALLGENGSGKTTLMNILSGIYYPDEGRITVNGEEVTIRSPKEAFELGIGMIHQHYKLVEVLTAAENITLGLKGGLTVKRRELVQEIRELTEKYGFELELDGAIGAAANFPKWAVILFVYAIVLFMNFFIASGSAKAFMLIPLIVPLAGAFGIPAQLCILAFCFGGIALLSVNLSFHAIIILAVPPLISAQYRENKKIAVITSMT